MTTIDLDWCLDLVNRAREALGDPPLAELPKGYRKQAQGCPVAVALGHNVSVTRDNLWVPDLTRADVEAVARAWGMPTVGEFKSHREITLPEPLADLVVAFDNGQLPALYAEGPQL